MIKQITGQIIIVYSWIIVVESEVSPRRKIRGIK